MSAHQSSSAGRHEGPRLTAEQLNQAILDSSHDCIKVLDLAGRLTYMNEIGRRAMGIKDIGALIGASWIQFWDGPYRIAAENAVQTASAGSEGRLIGPCEMPDGTRKWWNVRITPIRNELGIISSLLAISRDVTAERGTETALEESEGRLRVLMQLMPAAVYTCDSAGRITFFNRRAVEFWGREPRPEDTDQKFCGALRLWWPDGRPLPHAETPMAVALKTGAPCRDAEVVIERPDGSRVTVLVNIDAIRDASGAVTAAINVFQDISELKRIEKERIQSERLYRALGESIDYGIWVCDPNGKNIYASESFLKLVGLTQQQCSEFGWGDVLHPDDAAQTIAAWKKCATTGEFWEREHRFRAVDGQWRYVLARGVPIRDDAGGIICWAGINLDIDAMKKTELALIDSDKRKDQFLAMLSHELRNPLTPIHNALHVMRMAGPLGKQLDWARDVIDRQLKHLTRLVDDLLDVSRITQGKIALKKEHVEVRTIVEQAIEATRPHIDSRRLQLYVTLPDQPVRVDADPTRMTQVVANLLHNAAKYTPERGEIHVKVMVDEGAAVIRVVDTGVGISADMLPCIFDLFSQAEQSLDRSEGGLGIGLTVARSLVQLHGGTIKAFSDGPGRGAELAVYLPLVVAPEIHVDHEPGEASPSAGRRILVIEDNLDSAESMALLLQMLGHEVQMRFDGSDALEAARAFRPDVIVMDIGLPHISGYELAQQLRRTGEFDDTIMIALTGYGQDSDRMRSREAGFNAHVVKPVDPFTLGKLIEDISRR